MTHSTASSKPSRESHAPGSQQERGLPTDARRLVYVRAADLDRWQCRPFETIDILDLEDRPVGQLDGIVIDQRGNRPIYFVVARRPGSGKERQTSFLVPVGDAWFDETERASVWTHPNGSACRSIPTSSSG